MKTEILNELKDILKNPISTSAFAGMIFNATLTEAGSKFDIQENIEHALRIKVKMRELAKEDSISEEDVLIQEDERSVSEEKEVLRR